PPPVGRIARTSTPARRPSTICRWWGRKDLNPKWRLRIASISGRSVCTGTDLANNSRLKADPHRSGIDHAPRVPGIRETHSNRLYQVELRTGEMAAPLSGERGSLRALDRDGHPR